MRFDLYHHSADSKLEHLLQRLLVQGDQLMSSQAELTAQVAAVNAKLTKIGAETQSLLTKIDELNAVIAAGAPVTPELKAAVDALVAQAEVVDKLVPDAPVPPTPPTP